ncbi:MAG: ABC transporter substrate-binding protein, partial [Pseudarthrobacter sp.]
MSHPIDVGSVLGGRYKVTATVLTSHDQDLVLDGMDQVLNRPVSILVAGPDTTE